MANLTSEVLKPIESLKASEFDALFMPDGLQKANKFSDLNCSKLEIDVSK
jgi:hypothetical protein